MYMILLGYNILLNNIMLFFTVHTLRFWTNPNIMFLLNFRPDHKCTWSVPDTFATMSQILIDLQNSGMQLYYSSINYKTEYQSVLTQKDRYCCHNLHFININHPMHFGN